MTAPTVDVDVQQCRRTHETECGQREPERNHCVKSIRFRRSGPNPNGSQPGHLLRDQPSALATHTDQMTDLSGKIVNEETKLAVAGLEA